MKFPLKFSRRVQKILKEILKKCKYNSFDHSIEGEYFTQETYLSTKDRDLNRKKPKMPHGNLHTKFDGLAVLFLK